MSATIREIVDSALTVIGEVSGAGTQAYGDDRMFADTIRSFNLLFKKYNWHQYREWFQLDLDGTLGIIDEDALEQVKDFEDFIAVHKDGETLPLPILRKSANPFVVTGGTQVTHWSSLPVTSEHYVARRLQFWPKASIGTVNIHAMVYPATVLEPWDWSDHMYLDMDMLAYGAAFMTLATDDINSNAANMTKTFMEMRFRDITAKLDSQPIPIEGSSNIPTTWQERP